MESECSDMITKGLLTLKYWCQTDNKPWTPRYFLIDDSHIERNGIKGAFRGLSIGEQEVSVVCCTVHSARTILRRLGSNRAIVSQMMQAMNKRTEFGCRQHVLKAIDMAPSDQIKDYIRKNWLGRISEWALYKRQHSPTLLQVTSTNPLESYHNQLKQYIGGNGLRLPFVGLARYVIQVQTLRERDFEMAKIHFRTKSLSITKDYQQLKKLPYPLQQLVATEHAKVEDRILNGKEIPMLEALDCHCTFFKRYFLPCKHMFHKDMCGPEKLLTDDALNSLVEDFEEGGFDVFEKRASVTVVETSTEHPCWKIKGKAKVYEYLEMIRNRYFEIESMENGETELGELLEKLKPLAMFKCI